MPTTTSANVQTPALSDLEFIPYINEDGLLPAEFSKTVGIYAIFNQDHALQFVGYSRDITMSLKQHLVRCPDDCYWVKVKTIERPQRSVLEAIQAAWISENGDRPIGNGDESDRWSQAINAKVQMTDDEQAQYALATTELEQTKALKQISSRVETDINAVLSARGVKETIRFDPKLKGKGLLNVKPQK